MNNQDLFNIIASAPNTRVVNDRQIATRCFLCGDSAKNPYKKRLYIYFNPNDPTDYPTYYCFNCFDTGNFNVEMLHQMGIENKEADIYLRTIIKNSDMDNGSRVYKNHNRDDINVKLPPVKAERKTLLKIKYLYDRIGYKIPPEDFDRLKIVFNLREFLEFNNIRPNHKSMDVLDRDYVGFLSTRNEYVILRDITNSNRFRYIKYNIFGNVDDTKCFYTTRASIDPIGQDDIHIVVAEGPMDVLGIIYNVFGGDIENKVFIATCDGTFKNPIIHFVRKGLVGSNIYIDAYIDTDTKMDLRQIKKDLKLFIPNFTVYYNKLYKDFGVPKSQIDRDILIL